VRRARDGGLPGAHRAPGDVHKQGRRTHRGAYRGPDTSGLVQQANVLFIAVDTPQGKGGSVDLSNVAAVARGIGRALTEASQEAPAHKKPL
jgi:UDP-N-acetyl-D-mannosaminuronate dehydrogenase